MKSKTLPALPALMLALLLSGSSARAATVIFSDTFESDSSANWSVFDASDSGTSDFTVQFSYNYATNRYTSNGVSFVIPPAPNSASGATKGVKLAVNKNDAVAERSAVNIYAKNLIVSNNFAVQFDMWINYNGGPYGGVGSTEFAIFGVNHLGTEVNWEPAAASVSLPSSDGIWFAVTGEGGAAGDFRSYEGDPGGAPLRYRGVDGGFLDRDGDGATEEEAVSTAASDYPLHFIFPSPTYETRGVPGKHWVQVEIRQKDGVITWLMNGYVIAEKPNLTPFNLGTIMLGTMDIFTSIADPKGDNYVLFDNVRVSSLAAADTLVRPTLEVTDADAAEPNDPGAFSISRPLPAAAPLTVNYQLIGTAKAGEDYVAPSPATDGVYSVTIPAGASSVPVTITPIDDKKGESPETVTLVLVANPAYEVFAPLKATVNLVDDGDQTTVGATVIDPFAYEGLEASVGTISIARVGDLAGDITVNLSIGGSAGAPDFDPIANTIVIPDGASNAVVTIHPIADQLTVIEPDETVIVTVTTGSGYVVGTNSSATVTIKELGAVLYQDIFESNTAAAWTIRSTSADYTAEFGFDYGAQSFTANGVTGPIPPAPGSGTTTRGLKLTVNKDATPTLEAVNLYPNGKTFTGNYTVKFDMWINYNGPAGGGSGSTESALFGINHSGANVNWLGGRPSSDGIWFSANGEGGSSATSGTLRDYDAFVGNPSGNSLRLAKADAGLAAEDQAEAFFTELFPGTSFETQGAPGKNWVRVEIRQDNGTILWLMNGVVVAKRTNSSQYGSGNIMLGYMDPFSSLANPPEENFIIYDNLKVIALGSSIAPTITLLRNVQVGADGKVLIRFSATSGQASEFKLESSPSVTGPFTLEAAAIRETAPNQFEASVAVGGPVRFYRIKY